MNELTRWQKGCWRLAAAVVSVGMWTAAILIVWGLSRWVGR